MVRYTHGVGESLFITDAQALKPSLLKGLVTLVLVDLLIFTGDLSVFLGQDPSNTHRRNAKAIHSVRALCSLDR